MFACSKTSKMDSISTFPQMPYMSAIVLVALLCQYYRFNLCRQINDKPILRKYWMIYIGMTVGGYSLYYVQEQIKKRWNMEMNDSRVALEPLLLAEEHRQLLRQLRKNRDDEHELMKRVPGWVTGTLWGEPTSPRVRGQFPTVHPEAYFAHNRPSDMFDHMTERKYH